MSKTESRTPDPIALVCCCALLCAIGCAQQPSTAQQPKPELKIGSKSFTESVILGEMLAQLAQSAETVPVHRRGLGGTGVLWIALLGGEIDAYPEYTGTISEEILSGSGVREEQAMRDTLARRGIHMSRSLGFNNTYAIGMKQAVAESFGIHRISDLREHPQLKFGFSNEFMKREDGWPGLRARYQLPQADVRGLDHVLAYQGLEQGTIHATDLYSTDAEIRFYKLVVLEDDLGYFPAYHAVLLYRADLPRRLPQATRAILKLEGMISAEAMQEMNAQVMIEKQPESRVAAQFVAETLAIDTVARERTAAKELLANTARHLFLVAISLAGAILIAVPLGVLAARQPGIGRAILGSAGVLQTIPSLALLFFVVALLGGRLGAPPAIIALFLYSLLPIIQNTYAGLHDVPLELRESAEALGLPPGARLRLIELPLAARAILAGIKTSAVINVGNATLGGFIGAGGFGEPIFEGLRRFDYREIFFQGAMPAAALALAVQGLFDLAERLLVPRGLRLESAD